MDDFVNDLLEEVPEEGSHPTSPNGALGENGTVERTAVGQSAPVPFSPSPPATLARRTIGTPRKRRDGLKRLSQRHKLIIGLHLNGKSHKYIAGIVGCSEVTVSTVIHDPLAQEVITFYYEGVESELKALFPKVVDAVRDALDNTAIGTRLKGVDRFAKLTGLDNRGDEGKGVTVNVVLNAREKLVQEINEARQTQEVIEGEVVEDDRDC